MSEDNLVNKDHFPAPVASLRDASPEKVRHRSQVRDAIRRFSKNRLAVVGLIGMAFILFLAVFADVIAPYAYDHANFNIVGLLPFIDPAHPLGADLIGRDYLTRLIYGARTSMMVGLLVPLIGYAIAMVLGTSAGYRGGIFDFIALRLVEIFTAVPPLLFALFLLSISGSGLGNVILVLGLTSWIEPTRLIRAQYLTYREKEFVTSARATGATDVRIILNHILPNILTPLIVAFTFAVPTAIFAEAGLSFLGLGVTEPTASWGKMVGSSIGSSIRLYYHLALFPTILVAITMLSFSFVGDGLQEAFNRVVHVDASRDKNMKAICFALFSGLLALGLVACGEKSAPTATQLPTTTPWPTYVYQAPTEPPAFASVAAAEANASLNATVDPDLLQRGKSRWDALACGTCHGDQGQGTSKGSALAGAKEDESTFVTFLRSGGTIGNAHQYAQNKLSDSGAHNLYLYVHSLPSH